MKKLTLLSSTFLGLFLSLGLTQAKAADITFEVDMTGLTVSSNGVHITGGLNGWSPSNNALAPAGNNIFKTTMTLDDNKYYEFKFLNGDTWGTDESVPAEAAISTNRYILTGTGAHTVRFKFAGLPLAGMSKVTFKCDLSAQTVTNSVRLVGGLNGWNSDNLVMVKEGATSIYAYSLYLQNGVEHDYKFINGTAATGWGGIEELAGLACVNASNNRTITVTQESTVTNTFGSCATPTSVKNIEASNISLYPIPAVSELNINGIESIAKIDIISSVGSVVKTVFVENSASISINELPEGLYLLQITINDQVLVKKFTKK